MSKKAYLIDFSIMTRIVVDSNTTEEEIIVEATNKLLQDTDDLRIRFLEGCTEIDNDIEVPYNPEYDS